jgi:hypothetical protein
MKCQIQSYGSWHILVALLAALVAAMFASTAGAQQCTVEPASIPLGQTVRLRCEIPTATARLNGRTVRLYKQGTGDWLGLMPVAVADTPGAYPIEFLAEDGTALASVGLTIRKTIFPSQNVVLAPQIEALHSTPEEMQTLTTFRDSVSDVKYWEDPLVAPVPGCVISPFRCEAASQRKANGRISRRNRPARVRRNSHSRRRSRRRKNRPAIQRPRRHRSHRPRPGPRDHVPAHVETER